MQSARVPKVYEWIGKGQKFCVFMGGLVATATRSKPADVKSHLGTVGPLLADVLQFLSAWTWAITPLLLIIAAALGSARKRYGDPEIWKELQKAIDAFRDEVFGKLDGSNPQHHHRVTLYRYKNFCLTKSVFSAWLVPVVRSGLFSKSNVRVFKVDRNSAGNASGITGRAWESEGAIHIQDLPAAGAGASTEDIAKYADVTNVTVGDLRKKPSHSRAFWAVRVEAKGEPWGVLVVDCVSPTVDKKKAERAFASRAQTFSLLLQRA